MRTLIGRFFVAAFFFVTAAVGFANPFKSKVIASTDSVVEITVPGDHFMKITNFTQDGGTVRGVVQVVLPGDQENGGATNVLTAARIDSTASNGQSAPEIINRVSIAGPAIVRISPVVGAKLFITFKKERDEGSGGSGGGGGTPSPIPILSATPGPTPSPTFNPFISPTPVG